MDAGLAKVINSTVGTSGLKSLDKIFTDSIRLVGSEDVMYVYDGTFTKRTQEESILNTLTADKYITFDTPGAVRIKTDQIIYANSDANATDGKPVRIKLSVLDENGAVIASVESEYIAVNMVAITLWLDLNVVPGKKYKVKIGGRAVGQLVGGGEIWSQYMSKSFSVCGKTMFFAAKVTTTT